MAGRYSIETVFKLIDNITTPLDKIGVKGNKVGKIIKRDFMAAQDTLDNFGKKLKTIGGYALGAGIGAVGVGIGIATKQFIDYDQAITAATAKFKDLDVTSETYAESLKKVGQAARDVAAITEYDAVDTAGALDKMAMAGLTSEQSMKLLMGTTNLATAAGMDLTTAVDIATDSLGAFGLMAEDASHLQTNLDRVSDVMAKTTNMFNTDMPGMFEAIKKGGPAFTSAGQSIETFSSLIGVMASSGVKGSEAGTQLRNVMISLANPAQKAAKQIERMGIVTQDSQGNYLDIVDVLAQFEAATKSMGSAERAAALSTIFGSRAVTGINILLQEGTDKLRDYRTQLENAGGAAENIANAMRGSIKNKIENLTGALTELGFKFVEAFQKKGVGLIEKLTAAVSNFDPTPIIDAATTIGEKITDIIQMVWDLRYVIMGAATTWGIYKGLMLAAAIGAPILDMVKAVQALMKAQKGLNIVQAVFNYLLTTNPIGLAAVAIGIFIGLIVACEGKMQRLMGVFQLVGMVLATVFLPALAAISPLLAPIVFFLGFIISMISEVASNWDMLVETFRTDGIIAGLKRAGGVLLSGLLAPIQGLLELLAKIPGVGKFLGPAVDQISAFRNQLKGIEAQMEDISKNPAESSTSQNPRASVIPPAITTFGNPISDTQTPATRQPALLNLREGRLFSAGPGPQSLATAPRAASVWSFPVEYPETDVTPAITDFNAQTAIPAASGPATASPVPPPLAQAVPRLVEAVSVPVKYDFPEMLIPPELIRPVSVPVLWAYPLPPEAPFTTTAAPASPVPAPLARAAPRTVEAVSVPVKYDFPEMLIPPELIQPVSVPVLWAYPLPPEAPFTTTAAPASPVPALLGRAVPRAAAGRIVHPAIANSDPTRVDRIVPPAAGYPVAPSVAAALVPAASPMTRAEQMAAEQILYSRTESYENIHLEIALDKGLEARVVNPPKSPNVKLEISGAV